jgi:hypothetical protein
LVSRNVTQMEMKSDDTLYAAVTVIALIPVHLRYQSYHGTTKQRLSTVIKRQRAVAHECLCHALALCHGSPQLCTSTVVEAARGGERGCSTRMEFGVRWTRLPAVAGRRRAVSVGASQAGTVGEGRRVMAMGRRRNQ